MADLTGSTIAGTYDRLLALPSGGLNGATLGALTDGNASATSCISITDNATGKAVLAVDGSHANGTEIQIDNSAATGDAFLSFQLSGTSKFTMGVDDSDSDKFKIGTTAVETSTRLAIDSSGNVGIGETVPGTLLHISKQATTGAIPLRLLTLEIAEDSNVDTVIGEGPSISFMVAETGGSEESGLLAVVRESATDGETDAAMTFWTGANDAAVTEKMRITSTGNVGIGTTSPNTILQVTKGPSVSGAANITDAIAYGISMSTDGGMNTSYKYYPALSFRSEDSDLAGGYEYGAAIIAEAEAGFTGTTNDTSLHFCTSDGSVAALPAIQMTIDSGGNVGIGTATPNALLQLYDSAGQVSGQIKAGALSDTHKSSWMASGQETGSGTLNYAEVGVMWNDGVSGGGANESCGFIRLDAGDGVDDYLWFDIDDVMRISDDPADVGGTGGTTTGHDASDERLKNISSDAFPYGLDEINQLTPIKYQWKENPTGDMLGFGAQTTQPIIPEIVSDSGRCLDGYTIIRDEDGEKTGKTPNSDDTKLYMEYRGFIPVLVKAVQELSAKVTALENA